MQISRQADYAVRAMVDVARFSNGRIAFTRGISKRQLIPMPVLVKVVAQLSKSGLLRTRRGIGGGIFLGRQPEEITLLEIIEVMDGPITLNRCVKYPDECPLSGVCAVHDIWCEAHRQLIGFLGNITIADIVKRQEEKLSELRTGFRPVESLMRNETL